MKTINKIVMAQIGFCIGEIIGFKMFDLELRYVIVYHIILTIGYLYGLWHSKN